MVFHDQGQRQVSERPQRVTGSLKSVLDAKSPKAWCGSSFPCNPWPRACREWPQLRWLNVFPALANYQGFQKARSHCCGQSVPARFSFCYIASIQTTGDIYFLKNVFPSLSQILEFALPERSFKLFAEFRASGSEDKWKADPVNTPTRVAQSHRGQEC